MTFLVDWVDTTATNRPLAFPTESEAERHAIRLTTHGIRYVVVYEVDDLEETA